MPWPMASADNWDDQFNTVTDVNAHFLYSAVCHFKL